MRVQGRKSRDAGRGLRKEPEGRTVHRGAAVFERKRQ